MAVNAALTGGPSRSVSTARTLTRPAVDLATPRSVTAMPRTRNRREFAAVVVSTSSYADAPRTASQLIRMVVLRRLTRNARIRPRRGDGGRKCATVMRSAGRRAS